MSDAFAALEDQDIDSRVVLDYTSRDFTAIRSQLVGLAKGLMPEWETAGEPSDFGTLLMELFAYMGDVMHFYIDRTASEAFLGSAIRQQSVLYIANMLGYTPIGQQSASVTLEFKLDANATEAVTVPVGTRIHNSTSNADELIIFETDTEVKLDPTVEPKILSATGYATEGIVQHDRLLGICSGSPNTEFIIPDKGVVYGSVSVVSREGGQLVDWTYIANLSLARPTQPMFTSYRDEQDLTHLVFGDNAAGRIPPVSAEIYVTYRYGVGVEANLLGPGSINVIENSSGQEWWGLSVTNVASPVGGTDPESIDAMRQSIPRAAARIKNRAITLHDYADMALQVPGVAKSVAHGTVYTAVRVKIAPTGGVGNDLYMVNLCADVEEYMSDKIIIGSTVYAEPETMAELWLDVYIRILVHVQKGYNRTAVRGAVDTIVRQILSFDNVDFGTRVLIGQIYRAALAVEGVEWAEVAWLSTNPTPLGLTQSSDIALFDDKWLWDTTVGTGNPSADHVRANHATTPTVFTFSKTNFEAQDRSTNLLGLLPGDQILKRPVLDINSWQLFVVTATPTDNAGTPGWVAVNVALVQQADVVKAITANAQVLFDFKRPAIQEVFDVETDELLIPRIAPMPLIKTAYVINAVLASNVVTLTTSEAHGMLVGETIEVTDVTPTTYNGQYVITVVPSTTTLSYAKTNADIASAAVDPPGTIKTVNLPESETDYPDLSEEERTHDGLWVIADGGLLGT
jgi:hypothetical protein